jgi:hypothetical protein
VLHVIGFTGFLWLGLYILVRGDHGPIASLLGATALVTCAYFLTGGLLEAAHDAPAATWLAIARLSFWTDVLPIAMWLHLSLRLNSHLALWRWRTPTIWGVYGLAAVLILLGTATTLVSQYRGLRNDPPGPLFGVYVAYLLICTSLALANIAQLLWRPVDLARPSCAATSSAGHVASPPASGPMLGSELWLLVLGACCFLAGAGYEAVRKLAAASWDEVPSFLLLIAGLGAVGATVVVRSALLLGRDVRRDFLYNFAGMLALLVPFLLITTPLVGFDDGRRRLLALALAALFTVGHTTYNRVREWLDTAFFTPDVREERAAARAYLEALAVPPAGPTPELATRKAFDDAVRRGLTHLSDPTKLATSPLLHLQLVAQGVAAAQQEDNRLQRAAVLKEILLELLEALRPPDGAGPIIGDAWRFYNCLYYPYVRGISRRRAPALQAQLQARRRLEGTPRSDLERVVNWLLQVDEDTFFKWQRRGSDTIAAALRERERAAGGVVPDSAV